MENKKGVLTYMSGTEEISLSPQTVKSYLVNGNGNVTDQEVMMFMGLCKANKLNPFAKEVYLIKYGNSPATMVVSKEALLKRAEANPNYDGADAGVFLKNESGTITKRSGAMVLDGETVLGGWAEVWRKDRSHSYKAEVSYNEYVALKDGKPNSQWAKRPGTMIRKVALVQALREAFPSDLSGMYAAEENGLVEDSRGVEVASALPQRPEQPAGDLFTSDPVQEEQKNIPETEQQFEQSSFDDFS